MLAISKKNNWHGMCFMNNRRINVKTKKIKERKMYNPEDSVGQVTQIMAKLFAIMADEIISELGKEKGEIIVKKAVRRFANIRAKSVIKKIKDDGKEVTFETVEEYSDYPENNAWDCESTIEGNKLREINHSCPFSTAFRELKMEEVGKLYCEEIDLGLNEAFFGKIKFERPRLFTDGTNSPCEMVVTKL